MLNSEQILHDRYQLKEKLGERPNRQTWLAIDLEAKDETKQQVVIKLLAFGGQVQWQDLKLFEREAQILREVKHPCIPKYYDYFSIDDRFLWFALVEEYLPGSSLQNLLNQGKRFTEQEVKNIALELLSILSFLHQLKPQILHRDIKPSNIILGEDRSVYLIDFGAVQDKAAVEGASFTVVGTYGYTPIEQFGGRAVPASDLYALGATLIHLLTGTPPADLPQKYFRIQFKDAVYLSDRFANWLTKMTEPAVKKRFDSAIHALTTLKYSQSIVVEKVNYPLLARPHHTQIELLETATTLKIIIPIENILPKILTFFWITIKTIAGIYMTILLIGIVVLIVISFLFLLFSGLIHSFSIFFFPTCIALIALMITISGFNFFKKYNYERVILIKKNSSFAQIKIANNIFGFLWKVSAFNLKHQDDIVFIKKAQREGCYNTKLFLNSPYRNIQLAQNLSQTEGEWLMHEINNWL